MRSFEPEELDRIIEMAWEDRTTFEAIELPVRPLRARGDRADAPRDEGLLVPDVAQAGERAQDQTRRHQPIESLSRQVPQMSSGAARQASH